MKTSLSLTLLASCLLGTAVARPGHPYSSSDLYAYLSSKQLAEVEPTLEAVEAVERSPAARKLYDLSSKQLAEVEPTPEAVDQSQAAPSRKILKAYEQQEGPANFMFSLIDRDGNFGLCGCWVIAESQEMQQVQETQWDRDFEAARAHVQQQVLPYTFYELNQYGQLNICKCYYVPPEDSKFFLDVVPY